MTLQCQEANCSTDNLLPFLRNIACPTLIIRGEQSPFLSREDAEHMVDHIPRAVLREVRHSTHMPAQENPEAFKAVVRAFMDETL
jgi:pimeloyl-ACP methyl ester carboxylesterase